MIHYLPNKKIKIVAKSAGRIDRALKVSFEDGAEWLTGKALDILFDEKRVSDANGRRLKPGDLSKLGEEINIEFPADRLGILPANLEKDALIEKLIVLEGAQNFLLWNKKAGIASVPHLPWEDSTAVNEIAAYLLQQKHEAELQQLCEPPSYDLGLVQRLDTDTSGILLFALTKSAKAMFRKYFSEHKFEKVYWAIVCGAFTDTEKDLRFFLDTKNPQKVSASMREVAGGGVEKVSLNIRLLRRNAKLSLLQIRTCFGGRHIVRACLKRLGFPLLGDNLYGREENAALGLGYEKHFLHAHSLRLLENDSPFSKLEVGYKVQAPKEFDQCLRDWGLSV